MDTSDPMLYAFNNSLNGVDWLSYLSNGKLLMFYVDKNAGTTYSI